MKNSSKVFTIEVKNSGQRLKAFVLKEGHPTDKHVWGNYQDGGKTTYTNDEVKIV